MMTLTSRLSGIELVGDSEESNTKRTMLDEWGDWGEHKVPL
jgi:hypothetical protein